MERNNDTMRRLFAKYLAGECTPEETQKVLSYFRREEDEKGIRELIREEFEKEIIIGKVSRDAVAEFHKTFENTVKVKQTKTFWLTRPAQAATWLLLVMGIGALLYIYRTKPQAAGLSTVATRSGERKRIDLGDGSVVWLNAASQLQYPDRFDPDIREVTLEGEAFFEVAKDADRPFVIRSGELKTTVLGTSFNIRAYKEDKTLSVAVVTGKVRVTAPDLRSEVHLVPDQQAVFDKKERRLNKNDQVSASGLASWKEGLFQFRNTTFSEVTAILQRSYNVRITYDPLLENCPIILADFERTEPVKNILKTLLSSVNGRVEETAEGDFHLIGTVSCQPQNLRP